MNNPKQEPLPCPFCGKTPRLMKPPTHVRCATCGFGYFTIEQWNTRPASAPADAPTDATGETGEGMSLDGAIAFAESGESTGGERTQKALALLAEAVKRTHINARKAAEIIVARVLELDSKATPGPWSVIGNDQTEVLALDGTPESIVVVDTRFFTQATNENEKEDAKLIAFYRTAAPEMARTIATLRAECEGLVKAVDGILAIDKKQGGTITAITDAELAEIADEMKAHPETFEKGTYRDIAEQTLAIIELRSALAASRAGTEGR